MDVAWRWLVSGVVAISVGLAVWWTANVLVPVGAVLLVIGMTKSGSKCLTHSLEVGVQPRCVPINSSAGSVNASTPSVRRPAPSCSTS